VIDNEPLIHMLSGFMKHLPNLLKQESSSAATLVHVLLRMYYDDRPEHEAARPQIAKQLMPLVVACFQPPTYPHFVKQTWSWRIARLQ
jgi:hypothetical protein